jgi:hypothetical protein
VIGEFADIESIVALKDLLNRFDCDNFELRTKVINKYDNSTTLREYHSLTLILEQII